MVVRSCVEKILFIEVFVVYVGDRTNRSTRTVSTVHRQSKNRQSKRSIFLCLTEKSKQSYQKKG